MHHVKVGVIGTALSSQGEISLTALTRGSAVKTRFLSQPRREGLVLSSQGEISLTASTRKGFARRSRRDCSTASTREVFSAAGARFLSQPRRVGRSAIKARLLSQPRRAGRISSQGEISLVAPTRRKKRSQDEIALTASTRKWYQQPRRDFSRSPGV